jgi:hypothetical protein
VDGIAGVVGAGWKIGVSDKPAQHPYHVLGALTTRRVITPNHSSTGWFLAREVFSKPKARKAGSVRLAGLSTSVGLTRGGFNSMVLSQLTLEGPETSSSRRTHQLQHIVRTKIIRHQVNIVSIFPFHHLTRNCRDQTLFLASPQGQNPRPDSLVRCFLRTKKTTRWNNERTANFIPPKTRRHIRQ